MLDDPTQFLAAFRKAEPGDRAALVADVLSQSPASFRPLLAVCAARSADEASFVRGLRDTLQAQPENISALRALAWHHLRKREFGAARHAVTSIIARWPGIPDIRRELLRIEFLDTSDQGELYLRAAQPELHSSLARMSYLAQYRLARGDTPSAEDRAALAREVDIEAAAVFRSAETAGPHGINRGVVSDIHRMILSSRRIALVGNGPSLGGTGLGAEIDGHDLVIRCNFPRLKDHAADVGCRADIVFFNETLVNRIVALRQAEPAYAATQALAFHPDPDLIFDQAVYAANLTAQSALAGNELRSFIRSFCYTRPTTGLMGVIYIAAILGRNVDIYGFDFYNADVAHYFPSTSPVFLGHEVDFERWFVAAFMPWYRGGSVINAMPG